MQNKAVLAVEAQMRRDLYDRLQELPMSFHSKWQSGQLLSRATTDLSAIRLRAVKQGDHYVVNGTKTWISNGIEGNCLAVLARTDTKADPPRKGLSMFIKIDRDAAARFGITAATVDNVLYDIFGQRIVSTVYTQSNQYRVIYEVDPAMGRSLDSLNNLSIQLVDLRLANAFGIMFIASNEAKTNHSHTYRRG